MAEPERPEILEVGPEEFEPWYRQQHPKVLALLTVVARDGDVAREATAEAFARAYERWDRLCAIGSPEAWTYRVAVNLVKRRWRRAGYERRAVARLGSRVVAADRDGAPPSLRPELWDAVRSLPHRQRSVIALRVVLDLSEDETASVLGITRGAVSSSLVTARKSLASKLDQENDHDRS